MARLLPDGTPDSSFGQGGVARIDVTTYDTLADFVTLPDDALVVGGGSAIPEGTNFARGWGQIVHVLPDGALDSFFGEGGSVRLDAERNATATPSYDRRASG